MTLNRHNIEARATRVGASEVAGLMGLSPYNDPLSIYDRIVNGAQVKENLAMRAGNYLEEHALVMAKWQGLRTRRAWRSYVHDSLPLVATPDAYAMPHRGYAKGLAEVKTMAWQPPAILPSHLMQMQTQMALTDRPVCWHVALTGSRLTLTPVERDPAIWESIEWAVARFYLDHLLPKRPPERDPYILNAEKKQ